jgi:hypothetical protein
MLVDTQNAAAALICNADGWLAQLMHVRTIVFNLEASFRANASTNSQAHSQSIDVYPGVHGNSTEHAQHACRDSSTEHTWMLLYV